MATMIPRRDYLFYPGEARDILRAVREGRFADGPDVAAFERAFADYVGARHAIATATGRQGMELLLQAHGLQPGDEVIVPAYTLIDLLRLITYHGFVPVPVDVRPDSYTIDPERVAEAVTPRTRAIIGCHLFGLPFDLDAVGAVAARHGIPLIEDCAHAAGATYRGRSVGTGAFSREPQASAPAGGGFFSLEVIKPINCFGGGVITTNDDAVDAFCRERMNHFPVAPGKVMKKIILAVAEEVVLRSPLFGPMVRMLGHGCTKALLTRLYLKTHAATRAADTRFTNVQARVGLGQLPGLAARNRRRAELAQLLIERLDPGIQVQRAAYEAESVWYFFVPDTGVDAAALRRLLLKDGIDVGVGAEITDDCGNDRAEVAGRRSQGGDAQRPKPETRNPKPETRFPVTARLARSAIQVPLHGRLRPYHMVRIADAINRAVARLRRAGG